MHYGCRFRAKISLFLTEALLHWSSEWLSRYWGGIPGKRWTINRNQKATYFIMITRCLQQTLLRMCARSNQHLRTTCQRMHNSLFRLIKAHCVWSLRARVPWERACGVSVVRRSRHHKRKWPLLNRRRKSVFVIVWASGTPAWLRSVKSRKMASCS